jgi:hypothetical protein
MQALTAEQLLAYEAGATLDVAGFAMSPGDIVVLREFKMPPGRSEDELDAGGDGDVLVLLELQQDEALLQVSTAAWIGVGDGCTVWGESDQLVSRLPRDGLLVLLIRTA